jgi:hypothetical protein
MTTLNDIEAAIEKLPPPQVDELANWLEALRARRGSTQTIEVWLDRARGAAKPDVTTSRVLNETRGDS